MSRKRQEKRNQEREQENPNKAKYYVPEKYEPPILTPQERKRNKIRLAQLLAMTEVINQMGIKRYY